MYKVKKKVVDLNAFLNIYMLIMSMKHFQLFKTTVSKYSLHILRGKKKYF